MSDAESLRRQILDLVGEYWSVVHADRSRFDPAKPSVPVSGRVFGPEEMQALTESALEFWLTTGRFNESFEKRLAAILGTKHVLTVNSGSSANLVALAALTSPLFKDKALKPGDEIITCATGFPTTLAPALQYGLVPVFLDVHLPTFNMDMSRLEEAVGPRTRAIMLAHTLGNPFDLDAVMAVAKKHDLWVIEDCCDALGATWRGKPVGGFGDIGTLSFYPAHHITMGEGGAVFTDRPLIRRAMESMRDWGRDCYCPPGRDNTCKRRYEWQLGELPAGYDHKYVYSHAGYNLKITDMQAAVGLAQLDRLEGFIAARRANFAALRDGLSDLRDVFILPEATPGSEPSWFGFPLALQDGVKFSREDLLIHLNGHGIGTRLVFAGNLIRQPFMQGRTWRGVGELSRSDKVMRDAFWLGVFPGIGEPGLAHVIDTIKAFVR
ncbi:lipopolysaccharide biosynthesis protein RfbH [Magnetospirillum sp. UT-4]|uniref:lipopolysaccharide biosynthesis protein RfbH n=1 Tax=Magnetospirillum sp. UT-4 TaxID=2681467 RepID=UPI0013850C42|nr:lipopolysaccharide biosynthesis protein RfbH [Magnetospirillum sp. UT-4]CAA7621644.1 Lipopolysaccharide biosynthesis protein RfbH [Magnetospirillum sp. UT-4]